MFYKLTHKKDMSKTNI